MWTSSSLKKLRFASKIARASQERQVTLRRLMDRVPPQVTNDSLASACQKTCSSCCKKGKIFLPNAQHGAICEWLGNNLPDEAEEFRSRCEDFNEFFLYDQKDRCQFLDNQNLCRLHDAGVKPRECFWWPLHVYVNDDRCLEIRASTSCCEAFKLLNRDSVFVTEVQTEMEVLGAPMIERFRSAYPGSYSGMTLRTLLPSSGES
jgi:hypothetical protein